MTQPKSPSSSRAGQGPLPDGSGTDGHTSIAPPLSALGAREREVLSVLRELGSATVQQVTVRLSAGLAYTTVMTTLDRLFRKGFLQRKKQNRAFLYSATLSSKELEGQRAAHFIRRFFSESAVQPDLLVSCLVDAVHQYDTDLLARLESSIQIARAQSQPAHPATEKSEPEKESDR
ncbi:MAG TPA: BlaI/MecI/CopY family transcriptional regulator [Acidobacteriaceae bacterium]|jgi:predicted transcriptional regulator|nr:BlaI/MecI/CopY family transcriptional regulator [Acidobacteriaceae bacterium]